MLNKKCKKVNNADEREYLFMFNSLFKVKHYKIKRKITDSFR